MRRLISILLLPMFGIPLLLSVLAMGKDAEAELPACCQRNGKHHCMMSMDEHGKLVVSDDAQFKAPAEKCPYCPSSIAPAQPNPLAEPAIVAAIFGDLFSHPTGFAQTEAKRRISRDRSNQKRGPPSPTTP